MRLDLTNLRAVATDPTTFLSAVAAQAIRWGRLGTFVTSMQLLMLNLLFRRHTLPAINDVRSPVPRLISEHSAAFISLFLTVFLATWVSGIGLQRRKDWGRLLLTGVLAFLIAWILANLALFLTPWSPLNEEWFPSFKVVGVVFAAVTLGLMAGLAALCGWTIKKLVSPAIRAEFESPRPHA